MKLPGSVTRAGRGHAQDTTQKEVEEEKEIVAVVVIVAVAVVGCRCGGILHPPSQLLNIAINPTGV